MLLLQEFSITKIGEQEGGVVALMIDKALGRAIEDIFRAPDIKDARKVNVEIALVPRIENEQVKDVICEYRVKGKVPDRIASSRMMMRRNDSGQLALFYSVEAPDNPAQHTFGFKQQQQEPANGPADTLKPTYDQVREPAGDDDE